MGLELERLLPGGVKSQWIRDNMGRPQRHQVFGGDKQLHRDREYVWDADNRLKRYVDFGNEITSFEHDKLCLPPLIIVQQGHILYLIGLFF